MSYNDVFGYDVLNGIDMDTNERQQVQRMLTLYISEYFEIFSENKLHRSNYINEVKNQLIRTNNAHIKLLFIMNSFDNLVSTFDNVHNNIHPFIREIRLLKQNTIPLHGRLYRIYMQPPEY
jgi:hypothetical protein